MKLPLALVLCFGAATLHAPSAARAQGGPPYITNDPGTPGNANWEINLGSMQMVSRGAGSYQVPQFDLNFGVGDRIQLTYEIPYVVETGGGEPAHSGWSNAYPGLKWRFFDEGEDGWRVSTFPQLETGVSSGAQQRGLGAPGPRYLLPVEIAHKVGSIDVDFEAGYFVAGRGPRERILGLVAGRSVSARLELDIELYDERADGQPHDTTWDLGGRYKLSPSSIVLFMAGRSLSGNSAGQPQFMGYLGIQILLSDYGLALGSEH